MYVRDAAVDYRGFDEGDIEIVRAAGVFKSQFFLQVAIRLHMNVDNIIGSDIGEFKPAFSVRPRP